MGPIYASVDLSPCMRMCASDRGTEDRDRSNTSPSTFYQLYTIIRFLLPHHHSLIPRFILLANHSEHDLTRLSSPKQLTFRQSLKDPLSSSIHITSLITINFEIDYNLETFHSNLARLFVFYHSPLI
jgi:hypothetical protein